MPDTLRIVTNHHPRDVVDAWELPAEARKEFDYLDWAAIEAGEDSASFIKYRGTWYDLGEFQAVSTWNYNFQGWDGYLSDSFFSGILLRYADKECETVVLATFFS